MTCFRPCIDLHHGRVKQIVGATLRDAADASPTADENHISKYPASWFARRYASDQLGGGHVIMLGPGNEEAANEALAAYPGGMQVGGGIVKENASRWLEAGASHVIVTSALFDSSGRFRPGLLDELVSEVGPEHLVIDLSCKRVGEGWVVAKDRWQTLTDLNVDADTLDRLAVDCAEFLIHAADVEGLCQGIDRELVMKLGAWGKRPMTYAGGIASLADVELVDQLSQGRIDITVGSALDLFGGNGVTYRQLVQFNRQRA